MKSIHEQYLELHWRTSRLDGGIRAGCGTEERKIPFEMKILSLNIRHGGGKHAQCLLDWTICQTPDVVVYPEWRNNEVGQGILQSFEAKGFKTATACRDNSSANGILIAASAFYR